MSPKRHITPPDDTPTTRGAGQGEGPTAMIQARDIMTAHVVTVTPATTVRDVAALLVNKRIGAVPVVDRGIVVGIVSEGDLIRRRELGTERSALADGLGKSAGTHVRDVMSQPAIAVGEDTSLADIAKTLESNRIKRVLVMRAAQLVGIVTRADIVGALVARPDGAHAPRSGDDDLIRYKVIQTLLGMPGTSPWSTSVTVSNGVVELSGVIEDEAKRLPSCRAIEALAHVVAVEDHRTSLQPY
jgi:CBS domain-containing protein